MRILIPEAAWRGRQVRVELEDAPFGHRLSRVEWVSQADYSIARASGRVATMGEVRAHAAA